MSTVEHKLIMESFLIPDDSHAKALKPNSDGVYKGFPLGFVGAVSDNKTLYPEEDFRRAASRGPFSMKLRAKALYGENQHPFIEDPLNLTVRDKVRLCRIDEDKASTFWLDIYLAERLSNGGRMIRGDLMPVLERESGRVLEDKLKSELKGVAYSLRSIATQEYIQNYYKRSFQQLVTFDEAHRGGFDVASKKGISATEQVYDFTPEGLFTTSNEGEMIAAYEEVKDMELIKIFGCKELVKETKEYLLSSTTYKDKEGYSKDIFHSFAQRRR